jgi:hypothetical protein
LYFQAEQRLLLLFAAVVAVALPLPLPLLFVDPTTFGE